MGTVPMRVVTLGCECFEVEIRSVNEYQGRDGVLYKFYLKDLLNKRGKRLVSVFISGTLAVTSPDFKGRGEIVCLNIIRRALDTGALSFDAPFDERNYQELSASPQDFGPQPARTDTEVRQYIVRKAYRLAYEFPIHANTDGVLYPIQFDEPSDLDYLGVATAHISRAIHRLASQGLLEKVMECHATPSERLLSQYESENDAPQALDLSGAADDRKFARLAIEQARKSVAEDGRIHPKVGVVVVKDGRILATAHRGEMPKCHGEYIALAEKLRNIPLAGATVYTTLEPCTTRNPPKIPCAMRLTDRKVARVVIGMLDPDTRVRGLGQMTLRRARIATDFFPADLMEEVEELNREFIRDRESRVNPDANSLDEEILAFVKLVKEEKPNASFTEDMLCTQFKKRPDQIAKAMEILRTRGRAKYTGFVGTWHLFP